MAKYEYLTKMIRPSDFQKHLNELGEERWKLVLMVHVDCFVFRRKIKKHQGTIPPDDTNPQLLSENHPELRTN